MTYAELIQHLKNLPPSDKAVELFLRKYFTDSGIAFSQADITTPAPDPLPEGHTGWDTQKHTPITGLKHGSSLLHGQELLEYVHNDTGADIPDGTMVYFSTANGGGHLTIGPTRPDLFGRYGGMTTSTIVDGGGGWVTTYGVVHDVDITGLTVGQALFCDPTVPGGVTNTDPEWPDYRIFVGGVVKDHGNGLGDINVNPYIVQREVPTPVVLTSYSAKPARDVTENIHGGFVAPAAWQGLSLATPVALTGANGQGRGKLMFCVNAGTAVGTITVTGDTVDRDTGVVTVGDSVDIPINGLTTDLSGADANGVATYEFTGIYDIWNG
jgi:hypothetical protein